MGATGIGHTRWATHGKPVEANAHPHMTDLVSVVHNGIIENFRELKAELMAEGAVFTSDTDTEVIAHLITRELKAGNDPVRAVFNALRRLEGAFALAMIFAGYDDLMIVARQGSPLAIGYGDGEMFVGSDAIALAPFTDAIAYLEDGDWAVLTRKGIAIRDRNGKAVRAAGHPLAGERSPHRQGQLPALHGQGDSRAARGDRPHARRLCRSRHQPRRHPCRFPSTSPLCAGSRSPPAARPSMPASSPNIGSSAGRSSRSMSISPPSSAIARPRSSKEARRCSSHSRARPPIRWQRSAIAARKVSTSSRWSMCANPRSRGNPMSCFRRSAGPEIGVASTKAFTCQLTVLACLAIAAGKARGVIGPDLEAELVQALAEVPRHMANGAPRRATLRDAGAQSGEGTRRALSRARAELPDRAGRRA